MSEKKFHVVAGLPRAGSTLLCNILNQNPKVFASDTSPMGLAVAQVSSTISKRPEYTSELANHKDLTRSRLRAVSRGVVESWYVHRPESVIFDKDRSNTWMFQQDGFRYLFPGGKIIAMARDPREVFASALRNQDKDPLVRESLVTGDRTVAVREETLMNPNGLIGAAIRSIENVISLGRASQTSTDHVLLLQYERFVSRPKFTLEAIYEAIGEDPFDHDLENVVNVATDLDALYQHQWPHHGSGKVEPRTPTWPEVVPPGFAQKILARFPLYCQFFGYA